MSKSLLRAFVAFAFAAHAAAQSPPPAPPAAAPAPIPVETMFKPPAYRNLTLSPGGRYLAATIDLKERQNLVVIDLDKRDAIQLTAHDEIDVDTIWWVDDRRILYTTGDQQGKELERSGGLYAVDRDGRNDRMLVEPFRVLGKVKFVWRETTILGRLPGNPDEVLVSANDRQFDSQDVYRMNVHTGRKTLVTLDSPGKVVRWVLDRERQPRAALCHDNDRNTWWFIHRAPGAKEWRTLAQWNEQLRDVVIPYAFDPADPARMYVRSNVGRDTLAFFRYDPEAGKLLDMVVGTERYDMGSFDLIGRPLGERGELLFGGSEDEPGKLIGVRFAADRVTTAWFDDDARRLLAAIDAALPGRVNLFDPTKRRSLVRSYSATHPGEWYIFDADRRRLEPTDVQARPWIDPARMSPVEYVTYAARDGMRIGAILALPRTFRKGSPVPLVVIPHGGPWARDLWEFDAEAQFLANRGYAVLQPNFRGSTGYGARHLRASYVQWGGTMTDDIIDGVEWAIKEGYADRGRIGAYGASYGGLATLSVLVKRPDLFKWGINYVGVTDLAVHQDTQPAQLSGNFGPLAKVLNGDQRANAAEFEAQSPARHVARIAVPVFHAYGGEDRNVDYANGRTIRAAFDKAGKPYEWMFVADEAHGYRQRANVVEFYTRFEKFIAAHTPAAK